jgi:UrcA family protein
MKTIARNNRNFTLAAVAAVCLAAVAVGAHADEAVNGVPARTVHYADLNLSTQAGAAILYNRIRNAAEQVCGDVGSRELARAMAAKACVNRAIFASVQSVNNPKLTREYNTRVGAAQPISVAVR